MSIGSISSSPGALSIVVPVFNEAEAVPQLHARLSPVLQSLGQPYEIVFVDDGSSDNSPRILHDLRTADPAVAVIRFSRNFGKECALSAGLHHARGEAVIMLDADLQHPPEMIPQMLAAWRDGADVVNMRRRSRADEPRWRRTAAGMFYKLIDTLSDTPIPRDVGDFRLLSRRAVEALIRMPERNRFMKGLFAWVGFPQRTLEFDCEPRAGGRSKWNLGGLVHLAVEGLTASSVMPLRLASFAGLLSSIVAFVTAVGYVVKTLLFGEPVAGFPTLIVVVLMLGGMQLLAIGVLGEYVGRLSIESKQRPLYLVQDYWPARTLADGGQ